jgi:hypothetical protein
MSVKKKIKVIASPSEISCRTFIFNPSDHGFSDKEWKELSASDKDDQVKQFLESLPEQPYWTLDEYEDN